MIKKRLALPFLAVALLIGRGNASTPKPEYTMEVSLRAVRMSIADLASLLTKVNRFVSTSRNSSGAPKAAPTNELALSDGVRRFQVSGDFSAPTLASAPNTAYEASYTYRDLDGPITRVSIELFDFRRRVSVSGYSQEHVEALVQLLSSYLQDYETYWGGLGIRLLGFFVFEAASIAAVVYFYRSVLKASVAACVGIILASVILANASLTPGVVIYRGSPSFLVRFGPEISFLSLAVTVIGVVISVILWRRPRSVNKNGRPRTDSGASER